MNPMIGEYLSKASVEFNHVTILRWSKKYTKGVCRSDNKVLDMRQPKAEEHESNILIGKLSGSKKKSVPAATDAKQTER